MLKSSSFFVKQLSSITNYFKSAKITGIDDIKGKATIIVVSRIIDFLAVLATT